MNKFVRRLGIVLFQASLFVSLSHAAFAQSEGLYEVTGKSTLHGQYSGQASVSAGQVQRLVQWKTFRYQPTRTPLPAAGFADYAVQTVWTGKATSSVPQFSLSLSSALTSYEGFAPTAAELNAAVPVIVINATPTSASEISFTFEVPGEGQYQESWHKIGPAPATPLWENLRQQAEGVGESSLAVVKVVKALGVDQAIDWYRTQPETAPYRDRPEFKNQKQYFISDRTDAEFYQKNPGVLRLANRTLNPLAFAEALMRRNAYGPSLSAKAAFLHTETVQNNLNAAGLLEIAFNDAAGLKVRREPEYDAGLWTAMLGWAEILRYQTEKSPEALKNFKNILKGVLTAVEITGNPKEFARTLAISPPGENLGEGWVQGAGPFAPLKWRQGGNNDMLKAILITLTLARQIPLNDDQALLERIKKVASRLVLLDAANDKGLNAGLASGLAALWSGDESLLPGFYLRTNNLKTAVSSGLGIESGIYYGGITDWSGVHLSMVSVLSQILVASELQKTFATSPELWRLKKARTTAEDRLLEMQNNYKPAHRDFLTIMTYAYSVKSRSDVGFAAEAKHALWALKEIPAPRTVGSGSVNLPLRSEWCLSAWPRVPWKALKTVRKLKSDLQFDNFISGVYSYPLFEVAAWGSGYLWKDSPFTVGEGSTSDRQFFSSDYLLVYWAARSAGLLTEKD